MENLKKNLIKRGYDVRIFDTADEAKEYLLKVIDKKSTVGIGGSMTIKELGIDEELQNRGNKVLWHWTAPAKEKKAVRESAGNADIYLCSSNAVTKDGQLVNIDGTCNRIAGMLHGTGKVYMVIGVNKIAKDFEEAISRIKNVACPANAKRLGLNTPCAKTGHCMDCTSSDRMCNATLILDRKPGSHPFEILLVNQEMGY